MSGAGDLLFSVVIPCYQQGRFLRAAVDSVLGQRGVAAEVIVVDDGSIDDTLAVARSYGGRIRVLQQENAGPSAARNAGLGVAGGEWVLFLDADDWLEADALARFAAGIDAAPDAVVVYGDWSLVDVDGRRFRERKAEDFGDDPFLRLLAGPQVPVHAIAVRRAVVEAVGGFDVGLRACEDWDLWLRVARGGARFVRVDGAVACYRRYPGSLSRGVGGMLGAARVVLDKQRGAPRPGWRMFCARCRARAAVRYVAFCTGVWAPARGAWGEGRRGVALRRLAGGLLRHPSLVDAAVLLALCSAVPALGRWLGVPRPEGLPDRPGRSGNPSVSDGGGRV